MSKIIHELKCKVCGKEYKDLFHSFGYPEEAFEWRWKCDCGEINTEIIYPMKPSFNATIKIKSGIL